MPPTRGAHRWCPKKALDRSECLERLKQYYADPSRCVSLGVEEPLRCMQRSLDELVSIAKELLDTSAPPQVPPWAVRAGDGPGWGLVGPDGSDAANRPGGVIDDPLQAYATEAVGAGDPAAVAMAVRLWIEWAQQSVDMQQQQRKRARSDDGDDAADSQAVNRDAADASEHAGDVTPLPKQGTAAVERCAVPAVLDESGDESDASHDAGAAANSMTRSEWTDVLVSLVMHKWSALRSGAEASSPSCGVTIGPATSVDADPLPPPDCMSVVLSQGLIKDQLKAIVRALKGAVLRERHVVQRFASDGLSNIVAYHAKERVGGANNNSEASIPLIAAVRQQHGDLIAARDALAAAQHRFYDAQRQALVAMEDASDAADAIAAQEGRMLALLEGTVTECNAVDEIRQVLLKDVKMLKQVLRGRGHSSH